MHNRPEQYFNFLSLYTQDILELRHLFRTYFQRVEILLDDIPLLDPAQLEHYESTYEAEKLVMRGHYQELAGQGEQLQFRPVELYVTPFSVTLLGWNATDTQAPEASRQIAAFFQRREHPLLQFLCYFAYLMVPLSDLDLTWQLLQKVGAFSLQSVHDLAILLFLIVYSLLFMLMLFRVFLYFVKSWKIRKFNYILPGVIRHTRFPSHQVRTVGWTWVAAIIVGFFFYLLFVFMLFFIYRL